MAGRKNRIGLDYFSLECTFKKDDIELIEAKCGLVAFAVIVKLWQKIYRNGYFIKFDDDNMMLFSRKIMHPIDEIEKIILECFKRDLFDQGIYLKYKILTGQGIQRRYLEACKICKRKRIIINQELMLINPEEMDINSELIYENSELLPQSKVKRKERESKEKEEKTFVDSDESTSHQDSLFPDGELFKGEHVVKTESEKAESFFEEVWKDYPKKSGKSEITITQKKTIFKLGDEFKRAMKRYSDFLEAEKGRGFKRPPVDGKKFFKKAYVDYLDSNYVKEDLQEDEEDALKGTIYDPEYAHLWADQEGIRK